MPDFTIAGNPGAIRSRAALTVDKGQAFFDTGEALSKITTGAWTGRAADTWIEATDAEPQRWIEAGNGFVRAGNALVVYATAVENAQSMADWADGEYARGVQVSHDAKAAYDADVSQARATANSYLPQGIPYDLTIVPFDDPGAEIQTNAVAEFDRAKGQLESAASTCAGEVRAGCRDAPEEPNWLESGLSFVGGVLQGAGEASWDLAKLTAIVPGSPMFFYELTNTMADLASGDLTVEEWAKQQDLKLETAQATLQALKDDPLEFGKNLGMALLDWDTWADDPARAIGHLVPDAIAAVATGGAGAAATRGVKGVSDLAGALGSLGRHGGDLAGGLGDLGRHGDDLANLGNLGDLPDHLPDGPGTPDLTSAQADAIADYSGSAYGNLNSALRGDGPLPPHLGELSDNLSSALHDLPASPGETSRGTHLPQEVLDSITSTGRYTDDGFASSSSDPGTAASFRESQNVNVLMHIDGQTGRDVSGLSSVGREAEVLFDKGTPFEARMTWNEGGYWDVYLKEITR